MRPRSFVLALLGSCVATLSLACSDTGTHELVVEGSEAVTAGLDMTATDGWQISFTALQVVVHNPGLIERTDRDPAWVDEAGVTVWDVVMPVEDGESLSSVIRATRYDGAQFRIAPASVSGYEAVAGNVSADVLGQAVDDDWSIHVVGNATGPGGSVAFDWSFDTNTFYRCKFEGDEVVTLTADGDETTVIEILGEALFRSSADDPAASLAFQPIADADSDGDGNVTLTELDAAGLLDTVMELSKQLGGVRGAGACPEYTDG